MSEGNAVTDTAALPVQLDAGPCGDFSELDGIVSVAERLTGFSVAVTVQIAVALPEQLLGAGVGADLPAGQPCAAACGDGGRLQSRGIGLRLAGAAVAPVVPRPRDATRGGPDPQSPQARLGFQAAVGVAIAA